MNRNLGVWTSQDCALVLIDYQKEMFEVIRSETKADLVEQLDPMPNRSLRRGGKMRNTSDVGGNDQVRFELACHLDALAPVGIRDGPNQPRAPPSLI